MLATSCLLPMQERGQDVRVRVHSGGDVGDRVAGLGRFLRRARDREETGFALDEEVIGFLVAVGTVIAISGNIADDDVGLFRRQRVVGETESRGRTGRQVLHHDVGPFTDQSLEDDLCFRMLDIQRKTFLRSIRPDKM